MDRPGYFSTYFPGSPNSLDAALLAAAMVREYSHPVEGRAAPVHHRVAEAGAERVGTDHLDPRVRPHCADTPEDLACPEVLQTFPPLKRPGTVR